MQAAARDQSQSQQAAAAESAAQQDSLAKVESEAAELRSDLLEAQVENERVMEALRRASEDKQTQASASKTLEVTIGPGPVSKAMQSAWSCLPNVASRCIHVACRVQSANFQGQLMFVVGMHSLRKAQHVRTKAFALEYMDIALMAVRLHLQWHRQLTGHGS